MYENSNTPLPDNITLMIVDDELSIRNGLSDLFPWSDLNIEIVYLASNGRQALDYIEKYPVDLVLSDIRMPVMDGLELAKNLQEFHPIVRTALLSAYADFDYAKKALRYGVCDYIIKPIDYQNFIDSISRICMKINLSANVKPASYLGYYSEIAQLVKRYIDEDPSCATLIGASERIGLSANYTSRIFHQIFHKTFSEYLLESRMSQALVLLKQQIAIDEISWKTGYNNTRNFKEAFIRYYGVAPQSYMMILKEEER